MQTPNPSAPVIIVGGGPVGLSAALELARFDVPSIVLERHATTTSHPKARVINTRTMEIAAGWGRGVYQRLRGIDMPQNWKSPIRFVTSVTGEDMGTIATQGFAGAGPEISPTFSLLSSQDLFEQICYDAAAATGLVDLRFGHQAGKLLSGWRESDEVASLEVLDTSTKQSYRLDGPAIIAADGAESSIRQQLNVALEGPRNVAHYINCYFRADIERHVGERRAVIFFVANPGAAGALQPLDAQGRWLCQIAVSSEDWDTSLYDKDRFTAWIRAAVGTDDVEPEILAIGRWRVHASVAERFVQERILLCGDAAHQLPPSGGLGVNNGIQGVHNAMWKLALVVRGVADKALLRSYEVERRPVTRWVADQSLQNHKDVTLIRAATLENGVPSQKARDLVTATRRYGNHFGVEFGLHYESSAVVSDGTPLPSVEDSYSDYAPTARPGHRAPHVWLGRDSGRLSTLDLFGAGFTLLAGPEGGVWSEAVRAVRQNVGVPLASYRIGSPGLEDRDGVFLERYGLEADGAVLVRPDGYAAWRAKTAAAEPSAQLTAVLLDILGRPSDDGTSSFGNTRSGNAPSKNQ